MRPGLQRDVHHLFGEVARGAVIATKTREFDRAAARPDTDNGSPVAQLVQQVAVLGEPQRVVERGHHDARADPGLSKLGRQVGAKDKRVGERVVPREVMLGQHDRTEAKAVGLERHPGDQVDDVAVVLGTASLRVQIQGKAHVCLREGSRRV